MAIHRACAVPRILLIADFSHERAHGDVVERINENDDDDVGGCHLDLNSSWSTVLKMRDSTPR